NRIADKLARAVECNVTAAIRLMQLNAIRGKKLTRSNNVLLSGIAAKSDYWRVFQQQQRMVDASFFDQTDKRLLQFQSDEVIHAAEVQRIDHAQGHRSILAIGRSVYR